MAARAACHSVSSRRSWRIPRPPFWRQSRLLVSVMLSDRPNVTIATHQLRRVAAHGRRPARRVELQLQETGSDVVADPVRRCGIRIVRDVRVGVRRAGNARGSGTIRTRTAPSRTRTPGGAGSSTCRPCRPAWASPALHAAAEGDTCSRSPSRGYPSRTGPRVRRDPRSSPRSSRRCTSPDTTEPSSRTTVPRTWKANATPRPEAVPGRIIASRPTSPKNTIDRRFIRSPPHPGGLARHKQRSRWSARDGGPERSALIGGVLPHPLCFLLAALDSIHGWIYRANLAAADAQQVAGVGAPW